MLATQLRRLLLEVVRLGMQGERAYAKKGVKANSSSGTKPSKSIEAVGIFAMMIDDIDMDRLGVDSPNHLQIWNCGWTGE